MFLAIIKTCCSIAAVGNPALAIIGTSWQYSRLPFCSNLLVFAFVLRVLLANIPAAGQPDCRQKLDELRPYAPQLVAIAPDLEWVAQNELSIQLSISKIGSRNSLGSRFEGEGPNLLDIAVFSEGTFRRTSRASNPRNSSDLMPIPQEFMTDLAV